MLKSEDERRTNRDKNVNNRNKQGTHKMHSQDHNSSCLSEKEVTVSHTSLAEPWPTQPPMVFKQPVSLRWVSLAWLMSSALINDIQPNVQLVNLLCISHSEALFQNLARRLLRQHSSRVFPQAQPQETSFRHDTKAALHPSPKKHCDKPSERIL